MLGHITWLPGLKRLNVLKADDIVIVLLFIILKMSEANFNVNLPILESDDCYDLTTLYICLTPELL